MTTLEKGKNRFEFLFILGLESRFVRLLFKVQLESDSHHCVGLERQMQPLLYLVTGHIHLKFAWGEADGVASKWPGAWSLIAFSFHASLCELGPRAR